MKGLMLTLLSLPVLALGVARSAASTGPAHFEGTAEEALEGMRQSASEPNSRAFLELFTEAAVANLPDAGLEEARIGMGVVLAAGKVAGVEENEDRAVAKVNVDGNVFAVLMKREQEGWRLDSLTAYLVKGKELQGSAGKKAVALELSPRTQNVAYGDSAYCFTYVTQDPEQCKGRFDLWFCHNQDLHASKDGVLMDLGEVPLRSVKTIPATTAWQQVVPAVPGHTYVLRCLDARDRDFFVKFDVRSLKGKVRLDWTLLSLGRGAPSDIHRAQPLVSGDGADGWDGLCGRNG